MNKYIIGEKIADLRNKSSMTQKALGEYMGFTNRAISKWENGLSVPTIENLIKISKFFGVQLDYFCEAEVKKITEKTVLGMESLTKLYKIGRGPSSSHTIGPERACRIFKEKNSNADSFKVVLYGSLAKTGKGHATDVVIKKTFSPLKCNVEFNYSDDNIPQHQLAEQRVLFRRFCIINNKSMAILMSKLFTLL